MGRAALALAVLAVAGALLGATVAGDAGGPAAGAPTAEPIVRAGAARLAIPDGWRRLRTPPRVPGVQAAAAFDTSFTRIAVADAPRAEGRLPAALESALAEPAPRPTRAATADGRRAYGYTLRLSAAHWIDLYAIPHDRATTLVACVGREEYLRAADCRAALARLRLTAPGPVERLAGARRRGREALRRARTPAAQARAAAGLAAAYRAAAAALRGDARPLAARLARAHDDLARAARAGDRAAFTAAAARITRGERALERALAVR